jgi:hypothetical protein
VVLATDFIALPGLDFVIFVVSVVELELNYFNLREFCKNLVQNLCGIVEGETEMSDFSFCFQFCAYFISAAIAVFLIVVSALCVHKEIVEIFNAAGFEFFFENRANLLLGILRINGFTTGQWISQSYAIQTRRNLIA